MFSDLLVNQIIRFKTQLLWYLWPRYFSVHYVVEYYLQQTHIITTSNQISIKKLKRICPFTSENQSTCIAYRVTDFQIQIHSTSAHNNKQKTSNRQCAYILSTRGCSALKGGIPTSSSNRMTPTDHQSQVMDAYYNAYVQEFTDAEDTQMEFIFVLPQLHPTI